MKPSISGRRIRSCMAIQAPNETPAIQQAARVGVDRLAASRARWRRRPSSPGRCRTALAPADAAEVEAQHRKAPLLEGVIQVIDDLVVHGAAELRVRVQDEADRRVRPPRRVVAGLDPAGWAADIHFRHESLASNRRYVAWKSSGGLATNARLPPQTLTSAAILYEHLRLELFQTRPFPNRLGTSERSRLQAALHSTRDGGSCKR